MTNVNSLGTSGNITFTGGTLQLRAALGQTDFSSRLKNSTTASIFHR